MAGRAAPWAAGCLLLAWGLASAAAAADECAAAAGERLAQPLRGDALLQRHSEAAAPGFPRESPLALGAGVGGPDPPAGRPRGHPARRDGPRHGWWEKPDGSREGEPPALPALSGGGRWRKPGDQLRSRGSNASLPGSQPPSAYFDEVGNLSNESNWSDASDVDWLLYGTVNQTGLITAYTDPAMPTDFLVLDLAPLLTNSNLSTEAQIMVTAMATHGTFTDDWGTEVTLHAPLEDTENTMLGFRLSRDNYSLDVLQPQLSMRTSDEQSEEAFKLGVYSPWMTSMQCLDDNGCNGPGGRILIDAFDLVSQGFFATGIDVYAARLVSVKVFPKNVDITVEYMQSSLITVTFSLVALSKEPMAPRAADSRLGYFDVRFTDMGVHQPLQHETLDEAVDRQVSYIWRYPLDQLPDRQIKMYVDPSVPPRWRRHFKEGIEAWNEAFAEVGLPNAVRGVLPSDEDWPADYDAGDVRFSTVAWCPDSTGVYSMGIAKVDPRNGEIIKGDVIFTDGWVHSYMDSLGKLTKTESLVNGYRHEGLHKGGTELRAGGVEGVGPVAHSIGATGRGSKHLLLAALAPGSSHALSLLGIREALDSSRRRNASSDVEVEGHPVMEVVAAGLRNVVMHEVGHLLGLRHNFKGSMGVSYECTKNKSCTSVQSTSASVMDYVPMNIPPAGVADVEVFASNVGAYDKLAIRYGYMPVPPGETEQSPGVQKMLQTALEEAEAFQSCLDEGLGLGDPSCDIHDLSGQPIDWYAGRLELIRESLARIFSVAVKPGRPYAKYGEDVIDLLSMAEGIGEKLTTWVGGVNVSMVHRHNDGSTVAAARQPIPAALQLQALSLLLKVLRPYNSGLLPAAEEQRYLVVNHGEDVTDLDLKDMVHRIQTLLLNQLMDPEKVSEMFLREELPSSVEDRVEGLSAASFLEAMARDILGGHSLSLVTQDSQEWELQTLFCRSLRALHVAELPEVLAAHVSRHVTETRAAAGARLRALEDDLRLASVERGRAERRCAGCDGGDAAADLRQSPTPARRDDGWPEGPALLRHHLLLLRQELRPSFSKDPLYDEDADVLAALGSSVVERAAASNCIMSTLALALSALGLFC